MFYDSEKDKKYQLSSEFGLYRYHDCDEFYNPRKNRIRFRYLIILVTAVVVLSSVCLILYNHISGANSILLKPIYKINNTLLKTENNFTIKFTSNVASSTEIIDDNSNKISDNSDLNELDPSALKLEVNNNNRRQLTIDNKAPRPFLYESRDPKPSAFQPTLSQNKNNVKPNQVQSYPNQNKGQNIQEIIRYLTEHRPIKENLNLQGDTSKKIKFNGIYNRPERDFNPYLTILSGQRTDRRKTNGFSYIGDPFFPYKPQNPSDVNLLATNSFRFAPAVYQPAPQTLVTETYPKYEMPQPLPPPRKPKRQNPQKPITVSLTISPNNVAINNPRPKKTGAGGYNQNYHNQIPKHQPNRGVPNWNRPKYPNKNQVGVGNSQGNGMPKRMVVHLNLYPKKKGKNTTNRNIRIPVDMGTGETNHVRSTESEERDDPISQIQNATLFNQLLQNNKQVYLEPYDSEMAIFNSTPPKAQLPKHPNNGARHKIVPNFQYIPQQNNLDQHQNIQTIHYTPNQNSGHPNNQFEEPRHKIIHNIQFIPSQGNPVNNNSPQDSSNDVELFKSVGYTVITPKPPQNIQTHQGNNYYHDGSQWRPMIINFNDNNAEMSENIEETVTPEATERRYKSSEESTDKNKDSADDSSEENTEKNGDSVEETSEENTVLNHNYDEQNEETATLPIPHDIFEKYFNRKPEPRKDEVNSGEDEDDHNLINHKIDSD